MKYPITRININSYPHILLRRIMLNEEFQTAFLAYFCRSEQDKIRLGGVKIGQIAQETERTPLRSIQHGLPENYFSLGQNTAYYETINSLRKKEREGVYNSLNDIIHGKDVFDKVKDEKVFQQSIARSLGAINVLQLNNKTSTANANHLEFTFGCNLHGSKIETKGNFKFDKNTAISGSINILIGKNGCGKSQFLANLVASIIGEDHNGTITENDRQKFSKVIAVSYSIFDKFFLPDEINVPSRERRNSYISDQLRYKYIGMREKAPGSTTPVRIAGPVLLGQRFSTALQNIEKNGELDNWIKIMSPILAESELQIVDKTAAAIRTNFKKLGAGHKASLSILTSLYSELVQNCLVVVDEPENHLHPALIGYMMQALQKMLDEKGAVAIVATHSPIIVQEFPSKHVRIIRKIDGVSRISELRERSFGRSLDGIVSSVFGVSAETPSYLTVLGKLIKKGWSLEKIEAVLGEQLGPAARSLVASEGGRS